jgi:hypothetical protein
MEKTPGHSTAVEAEAAPPIQLTWLERTLKRKTYTPRYLFVGKKLLWMTCFFGSLGDALFGYDQGALSILSHQRRREPRVD